MNKIFRNTLFLCVISLLFTAEEAYPQKTDPGRVREAMKEATRFMVEEVSHQGGFLWEYLPDRSRQWGEIEARSTMAWTQGKGGTPAMGHLFLDAYHATSDEYYYQAALKVADALIWGQLPSGGWNYCFDFAGESALADWYKAIRQYNWPAQEFLHYYGNATFDDMASIRCCEYLLRIYTEKYDARLKPSLEKAIGFVIESQYPIGGWPQRYPLKNEHSFMGFPDYSSFITLNDGAMQGIIDFLVLCYRTLGDQRLLDPIYRGMYCMILLQQESPNAGWGLQYEPRTLKLATARPFEPAALASAGTAKAIEMMLNYYSYTADKRFLERIPDAFVFLESVKLTDAQVAQSGKSMKEGDILCPTFIEPDSHRALFFRRKGESLWTGGYEMADVMAGAGQSYSSVRVIRLKALKAAYEQLLSTPAAELLARSPLKSVSTGKMEKYFVAKGATPAAREVTEVIGSLRDRKYWPGPLRPIAQKKINLSPDRSPGGKETEAAVPENAISTEQYIKNMSILISSLNR